MKLKAEILSAAIAAATFGFGSVTIVQLQATPAFGAEDGQECGDCSSTCNCSCITGDAGPDCGDFSYWV